MTNEQPVEFLDIDYNEQQLIARLCDAYIQGDVDETGAIYDRMVAILRPILSGFKRESGELIEWLENISDKIDSSSYSLNDGYLGDIAKEIDLKVKQLKAK